MSGIERPRKDNPEGVERGVIVSDDPVNYLQGAFDKTPDLLYTAVEIPDEDERNKKQAEVAAQRVRLREALASLPEIGREYANLLREFCDSLQLNPGRICVYLVGGRVQQKPLKETSDFDLVITIENSGQGLQATYSDPVDIASKKRGMYKEWKRRSFEIDRRFGLTDTHDGEEMSLVEPKSFGGQTENEFITKANSSDVREAVLIYSDTI